MHTTRRAITLAETVVSTLLISFVLVSTLQLVAPISRSGTHHANRLVAANLANELSEEIATKYWTSPILMDPDSMGPGIDETRTTYDDIDDFHGWSSSPPSLSSGASNNALAGWTRSVKVVHVLVDDPTAESAMSTGLKRVTVTITKDGTQLAQIITLHSQAADTLGFIVPAQTGGLVVADAPVEVK